jgi:hypothetical protein
MRSDSYENVGNVSTRRIKTNFQGISIFCLYKRSGVVKVSYQLLDITIALISSFNHVVDSNSIVLESFEDFSGVRNRRINHIPESNCNSTFVEVRRSNSVLSNGIVVTLSGDVIRVQGVIDNQVENLVSVGRSTFAGHFFGSKVFLFF